jgi:hypothetical protein
VEEPVKGPARGPEEEPEEEIEEIYFWDQGAARESKSEGNIPAQLGLGWSIVFAMGLEAKTCLLAVEGRIAAEGSQGVRQIVKEEKSEELEQRTWEEWESSGVALVEELGLAEGAKGNMVEELHIQRRTLEQQLQDMTD